MESLPSGVVNVAAMAVVNAFGDVRGANREIIAGARAADGSFIDATALLRRGDVAPPAAFEDLSRRNTTLAVVAVDVPLDATALGKLARAAGAGLFNRITPVGSSFDGDVIFALAPLTGDRWELDVVGRRGRFEPMVIEALAVAALERAVERAVRLAHGRDGVPGLADEHGNGH
jgi:L-aminopeptidase/D-esterase-like protein